MDWPKWIPGVEGRLGWHVWVRRTNALSVVEAYPSDHTGKALWHIGMTQ